MSTEKASPTKLTLVLINLLFVTVGMCCMGIGGWVLIYRQEVKELTLLDVATNDFGLLQNSAILLTTSGLALLLLGLLGCAATYRQQRCLQVMYIGLVILCCLVTIAACALAFMFRDQVEVKLFTHLEAKLKTEYQGFSTSALDFSQAWDYAQVEFQCCGIRSYEDFQQAQNWTVRNSAVVPLSCCVQRDRNAFLDDGFYTIADRRCAQFPNITNAFIGQACYQPLKDWLEEEVMFIAGFATAGIILQVLAVVFSVALMKQGHKNSNFLYRDGVNSF